MERVPIAQYYIHVLQRKSGKAYWYDPFILDPPWGQSRPVVGSYVADRYANPLV